MTQTTTTTKTVSPEATTAAAVTLMAATAGIHPAHMANRLKAATAMAAAMDLNVPDVKAQSRLVRRTPLTAFAQMGEWAGMTKEPSEATCAMALALLEARWAQAEA